MSTRFIGATTNLGLVPYDNGEPRHLDGAPAVLRWLGLTASLGAEDAGDVPAGPYVDRDPVPGGVRNGAAVHEHALRLASVVARESAGGARVVVAGGDCSVVLGSLAGLREHGRVGLVYMDAHCDFATPAISRSHAVAGMVLAFAIGRGDHPLSRLGAGGGPLVREEDVVVLGRRDFYDEALYGEGSIRNTPMLDLPWDEIRRVGIDEAAERALERVTAPDLDGFWIHFDADVIDPAIIDAVDTPEPGGADVDDAVALLRALWSSPRALGMDVTIYDPGLDADRRQGRILEKLLVQALAPERSRTQLPVSV